MKASIKMISIMAGATFSCAATAQLQDIDSALKGSSVDINFRYRAESADVKGGATAALANTLKSRATVKTGSLSGFSILVEGDNTLHITDHFYDKENGRDANDYDLVLDQETTQLNQAYIQYTNSHSTIKAGNQRITLDNQRHVGGVAFRQDEATFDALSVSNTSIQDTRIFVAIANNKNSITNTNSKESIGLVNVKYAINQDISVSGFYYGIRDVNKENSGIDLDTFGTRAVGSVNGVNFTAEVASQNKSTATDNNFTTRYHHVNASTKLGSLKTTLGYEVFTSDHGEAAFITPLGTNHKFFGWTDVFLKGAGDNGIEDIYVSFVTKVAGVKLVGQYHNYSANEGGDPLGNELGFVLAKKIKNYGINLKASHYLSSAFAEKSALAKKDTSKVWLTASAHF